MGRRCGAVALGAVVGLVLLGPEVASADLKTWTGQLTAKVWDAEDNWAPLGQPGPNDDVLFSVPTTGADASIMDLTSTLTAPHSILSFTVEEAGLLKFAAAAGGTAGHALNIIDSMLSTADLNAFEIRLSGDGVIDVDALYLGNGYPGGTSPTPVDTSGLAWIVSDGAFAIVTGNVGPGSWAVLDGRIGVGHTLEDNSPSGYKLEALAESDGTIDSGVTGVILAPGDSTWTFVGTDHQRFPWLHAKRAVDLDHWTISNPVQGTDKVPHMLITEYMAARTLFIEAAWDEEEGGSHFEIRAPEDLAPIHGLRILQEFTMAGLQQDNGAKVRARALTVQRAAGSDPPAVLRIEGGSWMEVRTKTPDQLASPFFLDASELRYGPLHSNWVQWSEIPSPTEKLSRNRLSVENAEAMNDPESLEVGILHFDATSFIAPSGPIVPDPELSDRYDLMLHLDFASLDIASVVSSAPARTWFTGDTDIAALWRASAGASVATEVEVIAPDVCDVWFADVPESRCLKYWRSLALAQATVRLVDNHDNHASDSPPPVPAEAMYVRGDIVVDGFGCTLDLDGLMLYHGGALPIGLTINGGTHAQLRFSLYGDFNGDCLINSDDQAHFEAYTLQPGVTTPWASADYDGDCDQDLHDFLEFQRRVVPSPTAITGCTTAEHELCSAPVEEMQGLSAPSGGGSEAFMEEEDSGSEETLVAEEPQLQLDLRLPAGGSVGNLLAPTTTYNLHFAMDDETINGFVLYTLDAGEECGIGQAAVAASGAWASAADFDFLNLSTLSGSLPPAMHESATARMQMVSADLSSAADQTDGPLCSITTAGAGTLVLDLWTWRTDSGGAITWTARGTDLFVVEDEGGDE